MIPATTRSLRHLADFRADEQPPKRTRTPPKAPHDPFSVTLSEGQEREFVTWLCDEITAAETARVDIIGPYGEIDYAHFMYEQGRRSADQLKWPGAADLGSFIPVEKIDAYRARLTRTIMTEPVWVVEGWGKDAARAPFVEEFHQWKQEDERLQQYLNKTFHTALIEGTGILEAVDRHDMRLVQKLERLAATLAEDGSVLLDDKNQPIPMRDERGNVMPAEEGGSIIEAKVGRYETIRKGPGYRVLSLRDFLFLPGHAADKAELFGYAKRFYRRFAELEAMEEAGHYRNVKEISSESDRHTLTASLERGGQQIAEQRGRTAEKELWEVLVLCDLDDDGLEEWYVATISVVHRQLLRLRQDDLGVPRYLDFTPWPRADSLYGYSLSKKLESIAEEHAAMRNMVADRSNLATNAPLLRSQSALWVPDQQPFGPSAVIDVRSKDEITPLIVNDVPASAMVLKNEPLQAAERVAGLNDLVTGASTTDDKTLGERQIQTFAAEIRIDEAVKNLQETLETLFLVRNELWIRTLEGQPDGMEPPDRISRSLEVRGLKSELFQGKFTADMLRGNFRGKPRGSVETADKARLLQMFNGSLQALTGMSQFNPLFGQILQHPEVAKSILEQWARLYNVPDRQAFMQAANDVMQQMQQQAAMQQAMAMGGPPPMGPGAPPPGGGGLDALLQALPPDLAGLLSAPPEGGVM